MSDTRRLIHEVLQLKFRALLDKEGSLRNIIFQILSEGSAYLIGGFVRDVFEDNKSRDLDIVVDVSERRLKEFVDREDCIKHFNRLGGVKLHLQHIEVDIWSFNNNWAFKEKLVKLNEKEKLNSLAKGCFYNYDALVVNIPKLSYSTRFYESFTERKELDILQKRAIYKNLNPTLEANILRAIYIKKRYEVNFSAHLRQYLYLKMLTLNDIYGDVAERLITIKELYPKYNSVDITDITNTFEQLKQEVPRSLFD